MAQGAQDPHARVAALYWPHPRPPGLTKASSSAVFMHPKRRLRLSLPIFAAAACVVASAASAAGFGPPAGGAVLGQALEFSVPLRLEHGESIGAECVTAEVTVGDRRLPPALVRTALEMQTFELARVRVATLQNIDEPVVAVNVTAGCASQVSRRFTVLADPVSTTPALPAAAPAAMVMGVADVAPQASAAPSASATASPEGARARLSFATPPRRTAARDTPRQRTWSGYSRSMNR